MSHITAIVQILVILAEQTKEQLSKERLAYMASELEVHGAERVVVALKRLLRSAHRFPTVAEIEEAMGVAEPAGLDEARMIAEAILVGIRKFGAVEAGNTKTPQAIRLAIGDGAWDVVGRAGGWNAVIERAEENEMACRAQLRDLADAYLRTGVIQRGTLPAKPMSASDAIAAIAEHERLSEPPPVQTIGQRAPIRLLPGSPRTQQVPQPALREQFERERLAVDCAEAEAYFAAKIRGFNSAAERDRWKSAYYDAGYSAASVKRRIDDLIACGLQNEIICASDVLTSVFNTRFAKLILARAGGRS